MKKNLKAFVSSFMVGVMAVTSTAVPGLSVVSYADEVNVESEDAVVDEVASGAAVNTETTGTEENSNDESELEALAYTTQSGNKWSIENLDPENDFDISVNETTNVKLYQVKADTTLLDGDLGTVKANQLLSLSKDDEGKPQYLVSTGVNTSINGKNYRVPTIVTAKKDIKVTFDGYAMSGKTNFIFVTADGTTFEQKDEHSEAEKTRYSVTIDLPKGSTAYYAGSGTNPGITSITLEDNTKEEPVDFGDLTVPEAGKTYTANFTGEAKTEAGSVNGALYAENTIKLTSANGYNHGSGHGLALYDGDTFEIAVAGNAKINFTNCQYGKGTNFEISKGGEVLGTVAAIAAKDGEIASYNYYGGAGVLTVKLIATGEAYLHSISVENAKAAIGEVQNFELWLDDLATDSTIDAPINQTYGASTLTLVGAAGEKFVPPNTNFIGLVRDGKTVNAYKAGARPSDCNDLQAIPTDGSGTAAVFTAAANGMMTAFVRAWDGKEARVWTFNEDGTRVAEYMSFNTGTKAVEDISFNVEAGKTYVICTTGQTNNFGFCGFRYIADEAANVPVSKWVTPAESSYNFSNCVFTLVDSYLGTEVAKIDANTKSVSLLNGHKYTVKSADPGVGVVFASTESDSDTLTKDSTIQLSLTEIPDQTLTGKVFTSDGATPSVTSLKFVNSVSGGEAVATVAADGSYTATLKPGDYDTVIEADGYYAQDHAKVVEGAENVNDVYLKSIETNDYDLPSEIQRQSKLTFNIPEGGRLAFNNSTSVVASAGTSITVPVQGVKKVMVSGWYAGTWNINGQNEVTATKEANGNANTLAVNEYITNGTETSVTVNITGDGANYLRWIKVCDVNDYEYDESNTTLQVPSDKFPTLKAANDYIKNMKNRPDGEEGRMTIELTKDVEEQIVFDAPNVTLDGKGHEISWYYGVGTMYYSIDKATGLYDEMLFYDKYASVEGDGNLWGGVAIVRGDNFIAKNTTFKNNYNYKVTDKYKADVASSSLVADGNGKMISDVAIFSAKERSNAFYIEAKGIQVYNCKILSSQDTFGRNGAADGGYSVYVKDSVIGGNVDYICGEFKAVFDNCELQWKTYSDSEYKNKSNAAVGYIVAPKTNPYVFRNCKVTLDNENATDDKGAAPQGKFGRTWGKDSNATFMYTQTNGYISNDAWGRMSAADTAKFYEYSNFNGDEDFPLSVETGVPAVQAKELDNDMFEAYATDNVYVDTLGFVPEDYKVEEGGFKVIDNASDIRTGVYTIGNDTVIIAAYKELSPRPVVFTIDGNIAGVTKKAYDSIQFEDGTVITAKEFGLDSGYVSAIRVVGVRSENMSEDAVSDREAKTNGFVATLGFPEVADEAKQSVLEEIKNNENTES